MKQSSSGIKTPDPMDLDNTEAPSTEPAEDSSDQSQFGTVGKLFEEREPPEPMDLSETKGPVNQSSEKSGPSPDVATDGSIVEDSGDDWQSEQDHSGGFFNHRISGEAVYVSIKAYIRYMVGLAGLALVLLGCYNLFSPAIADGYLITNHHFTRPVLMAGETSAFPIYVSDIVMIGVGAMLAWHS